MHVGESTWTRQVARRSAGAGQHVGSGARSEGHPARAGWGDDGGFVALTTALMMIALLMVVAFAVDIARWYMVGERLQRTVDAAALAGVPYLPAYTTQADGTARANLKLNGLTQAEANAAIVTPDTANNKPSRLVVTASTEVPNIFAVVLGFTSQTVTRTATADYAADASMGSPCNVMGNEPPDAAGVRVSSAACPPSPNFWENIAGPQAPKRNGDRYATRGCTSPDSNCDSGSNIDYYGGTTSAGGSVPGQAYYIYKITPSRAVNMRVQIYDPMFIEVGDYCERNLPQNTNGLWNLGNSPNPFVTDANTRYAFGFAQGSGTGMVQNPAPTWSGKFCTGDVNFGMSAAQARTFNTTFALINPTDTFNPLASSLVCNPVSFGGFSGNLARALVRTDSAYDATVASNFRQWVDLGASCAISVPAANVGKDYYLMVRRNVPANPTAQRMLNPAEDASTTGNGHNRYGIRVQVSGGSSSDVAVSALQRMPIYANVKAGTTNFYLARVSSGNRGAVMTVEFFDTGDASDVGEISIVNPSGAAPAGCSPAGDVVPGVRPTSDFNTGTCTLTNVRNTNGYNGRIQRVRVPIPADYTCDDTDPLDCWYQVRFRYLPGVIANDTTTWSVSLEGDPVRLVK